MGRIKRKMPSKMAHKKRATVRYLEDKLTKIKDENRAAAASARITKNLNDAMENLSFVEAADYVQRTRSASLSKNMAQTGALEGSTKNTQQSRHGSAMVEEVADQTIYESPAGWTCRRLGDGSTYWFAADAADLVPGPMVTSLPSRRPEHYVYDSYTETWLIPQTMALE